MSWLKGFKIVEGNSSGPFSDLKHPKLVVHRTEGSSIAGAVSAYRFHNSWPHFTVDYVTKGREQHVNTDVASRALKNLQGGVETNRDGVINLEIVGYSNQSALVQLEHLKWLGEEVFRPIMLDRAIPNTIYWRGFPSNAQTGYGTNSKFRMSPEEWDSYTGVAGHCNVPENTHWDPGSLNLAIILSYAFPDTHLGALMGRIQDANDSLAFVKTTFKDVLKREPEEDALASYFNQLMDGVDPKLIFNSILQSPENVAGDD